MQALSIGQVARRAQVGVETIRFYEREGLVAPPPRSPSGYRQYQPDTIARLGFIQRAKTLGFSLREIRELLELRADPHASSCDVKHAAETKLADIECKISDLQRMQTTLSALINECPGEGPMSACPIVDALEHER